MSRLICHVSLRNSVAKLGGSQMHRFLASTIVVRPSWVDSVGLLEVFECFFQLGLTSFRFVLNSQKSSIKHCVMRDMSRKLAKLWSLAKASPEVVAKLGRSQMYQFLVLTIVVRPSTVDLGAHLLNGNHCCRPKGDLLKRSWFQLNVVGDFVAEGIVKPSKKTRKLNDVDKAFMSSCVHILFKWKVSSFNLVLC